VLGEVLGLEEALVEGEVEALVDGEVLGEVDPPPDSVTVTTPAGPDA
jgi:hypothetical protein